MKQQLFQITITSEFHIKVSISLLTDICSLGFSGEKSEWEDKKQQLFFKAFSVQREQQQVYMDKECGTVNIQATLLKGQHNVQTVLLNVWWWWNKCKCQPVGDTTWKIRHNQNGSSFADQDFAQQMSRRSILYVLRYLLYKADNGSWWY